MSNPVTYNAATRGLRPREKIPVWEWADKYRILSNEEAAEPGRWSTDRTPYMREVMEACSPHHPCTHVDFMKGAQVAGTEAALNFLGCSMDIAPAPTLVAMPTQSTAREWSRDRLGSMIRSTPQLSRMFADRAKDPNNTTKFKKFPGGFISIAHATSAAELRSKPIRYLVLDEIDGYPTDVDGEGDPVTLAERRTSTFKNLKKVICISTPTYESTSRIEPRYLAGDQRRYFVPCPHCNKMQILKWGQVHWDDDDPETTVYICEHSGCIIEEHEKTPMLRGGEWRAQNENGAPGRRSYHISSLYSPAGWLTWADCVELFLRAQKTKSRSLQKTFTNTILGLTFKDSGETPDYEKIWLRRGECERNKIPEGAAILTAGVDVQRDRLEMEIVAWGKNFRSWSIDYRIINGDPATDKPWLQLEKVLSTPIPRTDGGEMKISKCAIDSGFETQHVYRFTRNQPANRVMAVKGSSRSSRPLSTPSNVDVTIRGTTHKRGARVWTVGSPIIKGEIYSWLLQSVPEEDEGTPRGWCEFPEYDRKFFKGLTAEERVNEGKKIRFKQIRDYNEPLDCRVYARAATIALGCDSWDERKWETEVEKNRPADKVNRRKIPQAQKQAPGEDWWSDSAIEEW